MNDSFQHRSPNYISLYGKKLKTGCGQNATNTGRNWTNALNEVSSTFWNPTGSTFGTFSEIRPTWGSSFPSTDTDDKLSGRRRRWRRPLRRRDASAPARSIAGSPTRSRAARLSATSKSFGGWSGRERASRNCTRLATAGPWSWGWRWGRSRGCRDWTVGSECLRRRRLAWEEIENFVGSN